MLNGDFPTLSQTQVRHAAISNRIGIPCGEEMALEKRSSSNVFGREIPVQQGAVKKSSSALATTLSTCQVPGGTSLLVGCVLGKTLYKPKQQIRGSIKRKPSERRKELLAISAHDNLQTPNGKGRSGNLSLPRSISINGPRISNLNSPPPPQKFLGTTMTFLFDKVASVTDCRSTGHFVLPKRKVEEHFPPISKPGGIWMTLVDASGKEWSFEFCFWHSKDSRIYYFKKFYPYVQSTDLRGGDTVFFSRLEPQGTLFMGYRKQKPPPPKVVRAWKTSCETKGSTEQQGLSKWFLQRPVQRKEPPTGNFRYSAIDWSPADDDVAPRREGPATMSFDDRGPEYVSDRGINKRKRRMEPPHPSLAKRTKIIDRLAICDALMEKMSSERRSVTPEAFQHVDRIAGVLGSKGKRLRVNMDDYCEWKDYQDLLRPPPGVVPTVVDIDGHEFEEYEDPPVLVKRTFYSPEVQGENQWVKCDDCGSWRKLPADAFVPAKWICSDNVRDLRRAHCNAPQELSDHEVDHLLGFYSGTEGRTQSQEEMYDEGGWKIPGPPSAGADLCAYKESTLWNTGRVLVDGSLQKDTPQLKLEKTSSLSSEPESLDHDACNTLPSSRVKECSQPSEVSTLLVERRSNSVGAGAGNAHQMFANFDESAAQV